MGQNLFIVLVFLAIVYNLGAGLYYMLTDKGASDRTVDALTRRILISAALFALIGIGIWMGWIAPHGIAVR
ncbi:MAG: twin transmembrane helix small protein [Xanthomonadales bacterium]|nr:twin transmembrane helix small protein [Xanthomonadales bacterium]MBK6726988.1 twin transmembrane helix small protein [Xanthomonadales bacterium]MBK7143650.1 twin transmembrane helix small protein [Xanthomonadales bacterium]